MRLNKFLARAGVASRRKCDSFIESGKVVVNGHVKTNFGYQVVTEDIVVCNGMPINSLPKTKVFLVNKLKGYISTSSDPQGRKCVIDLVPSTDRLFTVGRLDRDTTGAILVTNDGDLANKLSHPRYNKEKKYIVKTEIDIPRERYSKLKSGLNIGRNQKAKGIIKRIKKENKYIYWDIQLTEGKNREIRRIFEKLDSKVIELHRYEFAGLNVSNIKVGSYKKIKPSIFK